MPLPQMTNARGFCIESHNDTLPQCCISSIHLGNYISSLQICTEVQIVLNLFICPMILGMFSSFVLQTWHLLFNPPAWIDFAVQEKSEENMTLFLTSSFWWFFLLLLILFISCYRIKPFITKIRNNYNFLILTGQTLLCQSYLPF